MDLREAVRITGEEISLDLNLDPDNCEYRFLETEGIGADYTVRNITEMLSFDLHIRVDSEDEPTIGRVHASFSVDFSDYRTPSFYYSENIDFINTSRFLLPRWGSKAIAEFRKDYDRFEPELIFRESDLFIYGMHFDGRRCEREAEYLLNGMKTIGQDSTTIYKIRHLRDGDYYRSFSYAIYIENSGQLYSFWAIFPNASGIDSITKTSIIITIS
jgi:hypothetical protein